jgi:uncharacterized Fe-S cluster protein YjdI
MSDRAEQPERRESVYRAPGVTVTYDARRCAHFAECVRGLPAVFDTGQRPWVQPANAPAELVAEVVRRCPTGALHYELDDGEPEAPERPTHVTAIPGGPVTLRGDLAIDTPAGRLRDVRAVLCGCGLTTNEPFCDRACKRSQAAAAEPGSG